MSDDKGVDEEIEWIRSTPVEVILGNHLFRMIQMAAVHLADTPPNLPAAQLSIDLVHAMIEAGGDRLGEHVGLYRSALAEVQQVYVRAASGSPAS
ncbi:MAG: hypothetical protein KGJ92_09330 [Actinomycetales bacterium]|nr:hypothetical protein [Actinomycetales bacterium]